VHTFSETSSPQRKLLHYLSDKTFGSYWNYNGDSGSLIIDDEDVGRNLFHAYGLYTSIV
jgi:hypothetical protein